MSDKKKPNCDECGEELSICKNCHYSPDLIGVKYHIGVYCADLICVDYIGDYCNNCKEVRCEHIDYNFNDHEDNYCNMQVDMNLNDKCVHCEDFHCDDHSTIIHSGETICNRCMINHYEKLSENFSFTFKEFIINTTKIIPVIVDIIVKYT
jgi:hypothetical protein